MPDNDIQVPESSSAETQEILKELEAEGHEIAGTKVDPPKVDPPKEEPIVDEAKADDATKEKPKVDPKPKPNREPKYVPVGLHNDERHKRQEAERERDEARAEAERLKANPPKTDKSAEETEDIHTVAKTLAEKHGLEEGFVSDLLESATKLNSKNAPGIPKDLLDELNATKALRVELEAKKLEIAQTTGFETEFTDILKEFPDLADQKEALKEFAFTDGNNNTSLRRLAIEYLHDNPPPKPGRKSAEAPGGGNAKSDSRKVVDFENVTDEDYANMDDETMEAFYAYKKKNPGK